MFKFEKENRVLIEDLVSGTSTREAKKWNIIYNILKTFGIIGSGVALVNFGLTVPFVIVSSCVFVGLFGIREGKVVPARKNKAALDLEKQDFMLRIQSKLNNGRVIDGKSFKLERTAVVDSRKMVSFKEITYTDDAERTEEDRNYAKKGTIAQYVRGTDARNGLICWLKVARESVIEQKMLEEGDGYVNRVAYRYSVGMLDADEMANLPQEVIAQTVDYDDSSVEEIAGRSRAKSRR